MEGNKISRVWSCVTSELKENDYIFIKKLQRKKYTKKKNLRPFSHPFDLPIAKKPLNTLLY